MTERRRIRYIGERAVPLTEDFPRTVLFVGRERVDDAGRLVNRVEGTGFLVAVPSAHLPGTSYLHVVTAAHVVDGDAESFVRVPKGDGTVDLRVAEWIPHPRQQDVAVALITLPSSHRCSWTYLSSFIDDDHWRSADDYFGRPFDLELGDTVYFIGLLGKIDAMTYGNIPMVRAGTLGRLWQERLPVQRTPVDAVKYITAHLIDCRSFAGFSGAPCYVQQEQAGTKVAPNGNLDVVTYERTAFLGLIGGHFDDWHKAMDVRAEGNISDDIKAPVSTGVGYVIPAEFIREALMRDDLVEARRESDEAAAATREDAATMDSTMSTPSEFERFERLARGLVNVPKNEADDQRKEEP